MCIFILFLEIIAFCHLSSELLFFVLTTQPFQNICKERNLRDFVVNKITQTNQISEIINLQIVDLSHDFPCCSKLEKNEKQ
jgi:hypothetical protein